MPFYLTASGKAILAFSGDDLGGRHAALLERVDCGAARQRGASMIPAREATDA